MKFIKKTNNTQFLFGIIFTLLLSFVAEFFFQWYCIIFISFIVNLVFKQKPLRAFVSGFIAIFILWGGLSTYLNILNNNILEHPISNMLIGFYIPYLLNFITGIMGGIVGGLGALVGSHLIAILKQHNKEDAHPVSSNLQEHNTAHMPIHTPPPLTTQRTTSLSHVIPPKPTMPPPLPTTKKINIEQSHTNVVQLTTPAINLRRHNPKLADAFKKDENLQAFRKQQTTPLNTTEEPPTTDN